MNYTKYHPITGEITSILVITDSASLQDNLPDKHYLNGHYHADQHYVDTTTQTPVAKPAKPSDNHVWDINNKVWVEDTNKTINSARAQRNQLLTAIDRVNPVWYAGLTVDQQTELQTYRTALLNVPQQSGFPATIEWPSKPSWL